MAPQLDLEVQVSAEAKAAANSNIADALASLKASAVVEAAPVVDESAGMNAAVKMLNGG